MNNNVKKILQNTVIFFKDSSFNHRFDEVILIFLQEILFKLLCSTISSIYVYYIHIFKSYIPIKKELTDHYETITSANDF